MKSRIALCLSLLVVLVAVGGLAAYRARASQERVVAPALRPGVVRCAPLVEQPYTMTESFHGLIEAQRRVDMAFQIAGRLEQLGASRDAKLREDDLVEAGQTLALLEPLRFVAAQQQARAKMDQAKAAMAGAEAQIKDAQARLADARSELALKERARDGGAANVREVERVQLQIELLDAQLDGARAQLSAAEAEYTAGQAAATMAHVNLQDATLRAPMRGLVARVPTEVGQIVSPGQPVVTLVDVSRVKLMLGVDERKLPLLKKGQNVRVEVQALASQASMLPPEQARQLSVPREGTINIVSPAADPVSGRFNVEIELDNADGRLRPGMIGKATVTVMTRQAIAIPAEAVGRSGEEYWAYFIGEGYAAGLDLGGLGRADVVAPTAVARRVSFQPVAFDKDHYLLTDLPEGLTRLVIEGQTRLSDGQPVTIVETLASGAPAGPEPTTK